MASMTESQINYYSKSTASYGGIFLQGTEEAIGDFWSIYALEDSQIDYIQSDITDINGNTATLNGQVIGAGMFVPTPGMNKIKLLSGKIIVLKASRTCGDC